MRLGIVASRFNEEICGKLLERARAEAQKLKAECTVVSVPGALEIPLALQWLAQSGRFDALVAAGRGDPRRYLSLRDRRQRVGARRDGRGARVRDAGRQRHPHHRRREAGRRRACDKGAEAVRVAVEMARLKSAARMRHARRQAREVALQALYAWQLSGGDPLEEARANEALREERVRRRAGARRAWRRRRAREADRAAPRPRVRRACRRSSAPSCYIGAYELSTHPKTPFKVVLNEAVELGKSFGGTDGHRFVNGVLEKIARGAAARKRSRARASDRLNEFELIRRYFTRARRSARCSGSATTARCCAPTPGSTSR